MKIRLLLSVLILVYSCSESKPIEQANSSLPEDLVNHSLEFKKEIIERNNFDPLVKNNKNIPYLIDQHILEEDVKNVKS